MLNKNRVHTIVYTLDELVRPLRLSILRVRGVASIHTELDDGDSGGIWATSVSRDGEVSRCLKP